MSRCTDRNALNVEPGDIFACWGTDWISRGISLETSLVSWATGPNRLRWSPAHVAVASRRPGKCGSFWFESTTLSPRECLESGESVHGVQVHRVSDRIQDYVSSGGAVEQYRLTDIDHLDAAEVVRLQTMLMDYVGNDRLEPVGYDTAGALFSGLRVLPRLPFSRSNLDTVFCSELIAALLQRLCRMNRVNPSRFNPGHLLRQLVRQGTYGFLRRFDSKEC